MSRYGSIDDLPLAMREQARAQIDGRTIITTALSGKVSVITGKPGKPRKYRNEPVTEDGHTFASKWEAQRYRELRNQLDAGLIRNLRVHLEYGLDVYTAGGPVRVAAYIADFVYDLAPGTARCEYRATEGGLAETVLVGNRVVEDTKSAPTRKIAVYSLKRRMFEAQYGMRITEVERQSRKRM